MSPEHLLACVAAYAGCKTYRDEGVASTRVTTQDEPPRTTHRPFTTAFARPGRLRFESCDRAGDADPWERFIVWVRGNDMRTWWDVVSTVDYSGSVEEALTLATGVSGGSAHAVPALLLPAVAGGRRLTDLARDLEADDDWLGSTRCYRLRGRFLVPPEREPGRGDRPPVAVWVDPRSFLVLRVEEQLRFSWFEAHLVTSYEPRVDVPVAEEELTFDQHARPTSCRRRP